MNDTEQTLELQWLDEVLAEANRQYQENCEGDEKLRADALQTQKELWEEVGPVSVSNELDQLVEFMEYIGTMKQQKRSHAFLERQKEKYQKIAASPYFGRIDFAQQGGAEKPYYIGTFNLINKDYNILVYDWRAPVSGMFYDFETGPASYECPKGVIEGMLTLKRQYKVEGGKLVYMFDSELKIDDEMLQQLLGKSADSKMKAIVTSIQREQNRAIRNEQYQNLIVQGPAGSGKTSVALHRAAYLLYKHRGEITEKNILIFSPNGIFNDYISNVLPELGEENLMQTTFESFMHHALRSDLATESYYSMMEYLFEGRERPTFAVRSASMRIKSSASFHKLLKEYATYAQADGMHFEDLYFKKKLLLSAQEQAKLFSEDYAFLPFVRRLEKLKSRMQYLLKPEEDALKKQVIQTLAEEKRILDRQELLLRTSAIVAGETKKTREAIERLTAFDLLKKYRAFFDYLVQTVPEPMRAEAEQLRAFTLEALDAKQLFYEDQIALLYLKSVWGGVPKAAGVRFVIIDEAQDYTPLQYEIFRLLFGHASLTILGDENQAIHPYLNVGSYETIAQVFPKESTLFLKLSKSYRSTYEISAFAAMLLGRDASQSIARHGEEPIMNGFSSLSELQNALMNDAAALTEQGHSSVGILTRTKKEAAELSTALRRKLRHKTILSGDEGYARGVIVMPAYLAKGLEFDAVLIYNASAKSYAYEDERLYLYTACTRALHVLRVYYIRQPSALLAGAK